MKKIVLAVTLSIIAFSANASTKYLECRQSSETTGVVLVLFATIDDDSDRAEIKMYSTTSVCMNGDTSCTTDLYKKEILPTVLRLTSNKVIQSFSLRTVIDINRQDLTVVMREFVNGAENTFVGKCAVKKTDESKKLL
jgi:hypothetical protein